MATDYKGNNNSNKFTGPDDREAYLMYGYGGNDTLIGNGENDTIYAGADKDVLKGEGGDDYLEGGTGNDTITGGDGEDIFVYSSGDGNDVITDYKSGEDKIQFKSGKPKFKEVGSDVVITVGKGKITVKGAAGGVITYIDASGKEINWPNTIDIDDETNTVTLAKGYKRDSFNLANYDDDIETVDASKVTKELEIIGNENNNKIIGTVGEDTIDGGKGADTIDGGKGNDTLKGGKGSDVFQYAKGNGKDTILDYTEDDKVEFTSGTTVKEVYTDGNDDVVLEIDKNNKVTLKDAANKTVTYIVGGEEVTANFGETVTYNNKKTAATLSSSYTDDEFAADSKLKDINASAVESDLSIKGNKLANKIVAGSGNDTIYGGKGNDTFTGGEGDDIFVYGSGEGNKIITDYESGDVISLTSGTVEYAGINGNDLIYTVGKGRITVKGAPGENVKNVHFVNSSGEFSLPYVPDELIAIAGNGKGATLSEVFEDDAIDANTQPELKNFVSALVTLDGSAVDHDISITGTKKANYIIGGLGDDTLIGGKGADTLKGGDGNDLFVWNKGDGNDIITDYEENDTIQFTSGTAKASIKGNDVVFTTSDKAKITVKNAADKTISYIDADGVHPDNPVTVNKAGTGATLQSTYKANGLFDVNTSSYVSDYAGTLKTIDASAVAQDIEIKGNGKANRIIGSTNDDTLWGGKGNDTLTGGEGEDVFAFSDGDGKDVITDYSSEDVIKFASGTVSKIKESGKDVIFTVGKGTVTVKNGKGKAITYVDADDNENVYPTQPYYISGETVVLTKDYASNTFDMKDDSDLSEVYNIDASRVDADLVVKGNNKNNMIICSGGDNTIYGGKGNDTINGGDGGNLYVYNNGDGNDLILDWGSSDVVSIASGTKSGDVRVNGDTVIFTVGKGKISMQGAAGDQVTWWEDGEKYTKLFTASNVAEEADYELTPPSNNLSSIVESKAIDCSFAQTDSSLSFTPKSNSTPQYTFAGKKK